MAAAVVLAAFIMTFVARAFTVDGPSMWPTLHDGERLIVDRLTYRFRPPARGEVVVFRFPADPRQFFIKRIVGVPGDRVEISGGRLYLNGQPVDEPYIAGPMLGDAGPFVVPPDSYFVLGDNRNNSEDSRSSLVGFVPRRLIVGRALWRYWPLGAVGRIPRAQALAAVGGPEAPAPAPGAQPEPQAQAP